MNGPKIVTFVGNIKAHNDLVEWCKTPLEHKYLCKEHICLVAGGPGIGKSDGIISAIECVGKQLLFLNKDLCTNSKEFKEYFTKVTRANVLMHFAQSTASDAIMFVDDIETLLAVDRTFINNFNDLHNQNAAPIKIVVSCNISELKALSKSLLFANCIVLKTPTAEDIATFLQQEFSNENAEELQNIAAECNGNLSTALNMVKLMIASNSNYISKSNDVFPEVCKIYQLSDRCSIRDTLNLDPWLHPLRFHENIMHEWNTRHGTKKDKEVAYAFILKCLCEWDQMMAHGKRGSEDFLKDTQTYALEHITSAVMMMSKFKKKKTTLSMDEFTRMFNYLSLKKKNQLALRDSNVASNAFPWNQVGSLNKRTYDTFIKSINKTSKKKVRSTA